MSDHGSPCWYELTTPTGRLDATCAFYGKVFGWTVQSAGMEGFDYRLAGDARGMVAGLMALPPEEVPPHWKIYFTVESADQAAAEISAAGGRVLQEPADIPGTGRFAVVSDPAGAVFGLLQPLEMTAEAAAKFQPAFDQKSTGRGNWHELMAPQPEAELSFYAKLFGWEKSRAVEMGEDRGIYQLFSHKGADIGGMMDLGGAPAPHWLAYFGVDGIDSAMSRVSDAGGKILFGPMEVPGGAWVAGCTDPEGAAFAIVGPKG
ncbi:VOC family protein [Paracoccus aminophilus]|uniref:Glyoxalase/bleomycin resistance protein/dioxygenase n=1 Tax=Paracoccus aminophilus JCM 7686 TaxID=1367847 RepID=S5XRC5_PARAH|nr:VOC family protein [Paracoccus aminophilus]AGT07612.1 glyoxalase/bleomycin resistance protein/dioxygenase [Paracoccus aminophilus JCM 7686]